ncbi:hypothetical protein V8F33_010031 [Rhypophila sp. PSN 637]
MWQCLYLLLLLGASICCIAGSPAQRPSPRILNIQSLGSTTSNLPNIYRDGGGGGKINGINFIIFSDSLYTSGGVPKSDNSNLVNFSSNSLAASNYDGRAIQSLFDFGTTQKGPKQQIPYYYDGGENDFTTAIWPNQGIATLCGGICGVSFPSVINRTAISAGQDSRSVLYNTSIQISLTAFGPVVTRPTQRLFIRGEPLFGGFGTLVGTDGYLYLFATITKTADSNGVKMARVRQHSFADRSQYQYWNGNSWSSKMPAYADGGAANIFSYSQEFLGILYGPGTGDLFYSTYLGQYVLMFQADDPAIDRNVYVSYSAAVDRGWSTPRAIYQTSTLPGGYSYSFHAYPNYDSSGRVIPLSWSEYAPPNTYIISMASLTFA